MNTTCWWWSSELTTVTRFEGSLNLPAAPKKMRLASDAECAIEAPDAVMIAEKLLSSDREFIRAKTVVGAGPGGVATAQAATKSSIIFLLFSLVYA